MLPCLRRQLLGSLRANASPSYRAFSPCPVRSKKSDQLPPRPTLPDDELKWEYLKGSGPGGQKINKTNSAVQITHIPTGIVVKSQETRSQSQNYTIARRILAEKVEQLQKGDGSRAAQKVERAQKKKASADKKKRRKYRKLDEQSMDDDDEVEENARSVSTTKQDVASSKAQLDSLFVKTSKDSDQP